MTSRANTWDRIVDWRLVLPPSRPAQWQLVHIRRALKGVSRSSAVAVLGATPELRDLFAELGFESVHVFEKNPATFRQMSELRCFRNSEIVIDGDWLDTLSGFRGCFSVVLSDLTSGNLPYEQRDLFYSFLSGSLRSDGILIDKVLTHPGPHEKLSKLEKEFQTAPLNLASFNRFSCRFFFCSELLSEKSEVDSTAFYERLTARFTDPKLQFLLDGARQVTPEGCRWWYGVNWAILKRTYFAHLAPVRIMQDIFDSPYRGRSRLYFLRRR